VNGLRGRGRSYAVSRYRVDGSHDLTLVDRSIQRGRSVRLSATLPAPAVELVKIDPRQRANHRGSRLRGEPSRRPASAAPSGLARRIASRIRRRHAGSLG
jgi:hypothetical protein